jgi:hypothetical protein
VKSDNVFINYLELITFCRNTGIIDGTTFTKPDFDVIFKAINYNDDTDSELNPTSGVVRYEFIEFIVRVALEKYYRKGSAKSEEEAV